MDTLKDNGLYTSFKAFKSGYIDVTDGHRLYYELSGNPHGIPLVYLHGGPGAGGSPQHRRYFNPDLYFIVQFDQRGAGKSMPQACTQANTTGDLVNDIEILRHHFKVDQWVVAGGSWGATLALAYGERHPKSCLGFILRGIFLGTAPEINWFMDGMKKVFPEAHNEFSAHMNGFLGDALFQAYYDALFNPAPNIHLSAARSWARYELRCSKLVPETSNTNHPGFDSYALPLARLEAHYFKHHFFLKTDQLMNNIDAISHLPAIIVQGRYDMVCPFESAFKLHRAWPHSQLSVVGDAGHCGSEPGICRVLVKAGQKMATLFVQND